MKYKIYTLENPITNEIRYVGMTQKSLSERLSSHKSSVKTKTSHVANWIKSLLNENLIPVIKLLDETNTLEKCKELEIYWISQFKSWGFNLTNLSTGGESSAGKKLSKKQVDGMSKPVCRYSIEGKFIDCFSSAAEADRQTKISKTCIHNAIKYLGNAGGYQWRFKTQNYRSNITSLTTKSLIRCKIEQYTATGEYIQTWNGATEVQRILNIKSGNIAKALRGIRKSAGGFLWKYVVSSTTIQPRHIHKARPCLLIEKGITVEFTSSRELARYLNVDYRHIHAALSGKIKKCGYLSNKIIKFKE